MIQYAENRKRWEESRKIAMTTVIQNSGIQLGWNRMRKGGIRLWIETKQSGKAEQPESGRTEA